MADENFHKKFFKKLSPDSFSDSALEASKKRVKSLNDLYEKVWRKCRYKILLLGPNKETDIPCNLIEELNELIQKEGFPSCTMGSNYYSGMKESFKDDIQKTMFDENHLIILINSDKPGVIQESSAIRENSAWKQKTMFFFKYNDYESLINLARNKEFPVYFKFPLPYQNEDELKAKVLFGTHHIYMYTARKQAKKHEQTCEGSK